MKENEEYKPKKEVDITDNLISLLFFLLTRILPIGIGLTGVYRLTEADYVNGVFLIILGFGTIVVTSDIK